jgi:hypothetical protein
MAEGIRRVKVAKRLGYEGATGCLPRKEDSFSASLSEWSFEYNGIERF